MISTMTVFRSLFVGGVMLLASALGGPALRAQGEDNPLEFRTDFPRIGGEIGFSSVWQTGEYLAGCGTFREGAKLNALIALAYDYPLIPGVIRFEALAGYQGRSLKSTYVERERVAIRSADGENVFSDVNVDFEHVGNLNLSYLFLLPSIKFYPSKYFYAGAGLSAGMLMGATSQYTKNILSKTADVPNVGLSEVYYPESESSDPYSKVYPEEDRSDVSSFALDAAFYAGAEFPIGRRLKLGPRLLYTLPLTPVIENPELKINTFQFLVGLRYDLAQ